MDHDLFLLSSTGEIYFLENLTVTGIPGLRTQLPESFQLYQNYPNPFNSQTSIEYYLPKTGIVKIDIFDVLGRKVKTLINQNQQRGEHIVIWDGMDTKNLPVASGVYIYSLKSEKYLTNKKLLLLK